MIWYRVIINDDTTCGEPSQYIFSEKCFGTPMLPEASGGRLGRRRSIPQTATHRAYEDKELG
jgi:hypothetical protein